MSLELKGNYELGMSFAVKHPDSVDVAQSLGQLLTSSSGPCNSWNSTMDMNTGCCFTKPKDSNRPGAALKKVKRLIWDRITTCPNRKFLGVCPSFQCPAQQLPMLCTTLRRGQATR